MIQKLSRRFENLPIRSKLVVITASVTLVSVIAGFALSLVDRLHVFREREVSHVTHAARITADFSVAPVSFEDPEGATQRLAYLSSVPGVLGVQIRDQSGRLFAQWWRDGRGVGTARLIQPTAFSLSQSTYVVSEPISLRGQPIGTLYVLASTDWVWREVHEYLATMGAMIAIVLSVSLGLAYWLQRSISGPIVDLAAVTRRISLQRDYSCRVRRDATDEIGDLYRAFNLMLQRIEEQDAERGRIHDALRGAYDDLEQRVDERTHQLERLNRVLGQQVSERIEAERRMGEALAEKEVLLREIHHRVKNNLQVIYGLLSLQSRDLQDERALALLEDSRQRVKTMAIVHETLYQSPDLSGASAPVFVQSLTENILSVFRPAHTALQIRTQVDPIELSLDQAVPTGLIINELVTNAVKYAFPGDRAGVIRVELRALGTDRLELCVCDDGVGLPGGLDIRATESLGLKLVVALAAQLQGSLEMERTDGTRCYIRFPWEKA